MYPSYVYYVYRMTGEYLELVNLHQPPVLSYVYRQYILYRVGETGGVLRKLVKLMFSNILISAAWSQSYRSKGLLELQSFSPPALQVPRILYYMYYEPMYESFGQHASAPDSCPRAEQRDRIGGELSLFLFHFPFFFFILTLFFPSH